MIYANGNPEDHAWLLIDEDEDGFLSIKKDACCDICEKKIPILILCKDCKERRQAHVKKHPKEEQGICNFCERTVSLLFCCPNCKWNLCRECKYGDDLIQEGINCCEYKELIKQPSPIDPISTPVIQNSRLISEEELEQKISSEPKQEEKADSKKLKTQRDLQLFQEFLELR